jgi:prefoldin subunit 5
MSPLTTDNRNLAEVVEYLEARIAALRAENDRLTLRVTELESWAAALESRRPTGC